MNRIRRSGSEPISALKSRLCAGWQFASALLAALACTSVLAQALTPPAGGSYAMRKQAIAGGGGRATGGTYVLTGTVGQALTDPAPAAGGSYTLRGGFHTPSTSSPQPEITFEDGFEN
jgi:hypothetical protein